MMLSADFLSLPIEINCEKAQVLCVENKALFRKLINALLGGDAESGGMVFSENFVPFDCRKNIHILYDFYDFAFPSAFMKKLYDDISVYCNTELQQETAGFKAAYEMLFDKIVQDFDYDFDYLQEPALSAFFKVCSLKPAVSGGLSLENLLQYILIINRYSAVKCFVSIHMHRYFSSAELSLFYQELAYNQINLLALESCRDFSIAEFENVVIVDEDLCEIRSG